MAIGIPNALTAVLNKIADLEGSNWSKWSKGMNLFFLGVGAEFITTGNTLAANDLVKASLDKQMLPYIYGKVSEEFQYLVEDATSSTAVWKELKGQFEKTSMSNQMTACQELYNIRHETSKDVNVYLHEVKTAVACLAALGVTISDMEHKVSQSEHFSILLNARDPRDNTDVTCSDITRDTDARLPMIEEVPEEDI